MKVNIQIDLTPEEARALAGLPTYEQMKEVFLKSAHGKIDGLATPEMENIMKGWFSIGNIAQDAMSSLFTAALNSTPNVNVKTSEEKPTQENK